ncbi:hypothetical protein [Gordonia sp. i37]|uniref:hypothetical protein n=1 Tax=Gordonia sp. i37 TaxID=1961707 RepID=UPI0011191FE4|nr:hypothetical protein [Gordonia sp. i37]
MDGRTKEVSRDTELNDAHAILKFMLAKLRNPTTGQAIAAAAILVALVIVGAVFIVATIGGCIPWQRIDWGNVPAWLSAVFSLLALAGIAVAYTNFRTTRNIRRDDEASLARSLVIEHVALGYPLAPGSTNGAVIVTLRNAHSSSVFTDVDVTGIAVDDLGCQQSVRDTLRERKDDLRRFMPPGAKLTSGWIIPDASFNAFDPSVSATPTVEYQYTDSNGRKWRRIDHMEPQRLRGRDYDPERAARFEAALKARPNGTRLLPANIDAQVWSAYRTTSKNNEDNPT